MKALLIGLIFSFLSVGLRAQNQKDVDQDGLMKNLIYNQYKMNFQLEEILTTDTRTKYVFPWNKTAQIDKNQMSDVLDTVINNYLCVRNNDGFDIKSKFPVNFEIETKLFGIDVLGSKLKNEKGEPVEINSNVNFINFGSKSRYYYVTDSAGNTITKKNNTVTLNRAVSFKTKFEKLEGSIVIESKIILKYDFIKITKTDIGKEIVFNGQKIEVLSINKGTAVLKISGGKGEIDFLITASNNQPYNGGTNTTKMTQEDFDFFSNNPKITMSEFNPYYEKNKERLLDMNWVRDIIIIKSDGEISNLYIYSATDILRKNDELKI